VLSWYHDVQLITILSDAVSAVVRHGVIAVVALIMQIIWALARLGVTPPVAWTSLLEAGMTHSVRDLWRTESALLLWGLGQVDHRPAPGFVDSILTQVSGYTCWGQLGAQAKHVLSSASGPQWSRCQHSDT
jgi:hypothetical protein